MEVDFLQALFLSFFGKLWLNKFVFAVVIISEKNFYLSEGTLHFSVPIFLIPYSIKADSVHTLSYKSLIWLLRRKSLKSLLLSKKNHSILWAPTKNFIIDKLFTYYESPTDTNNKKTFDHVNRIINHHDSVLVEWFHRQMKISVEILGDIK